MTRRSSSVTPKGKTAAHTATGKNAGNARRSARRTATGEDSAAEGNARRPKSSEGGISSRQQPVDPQGLRGSTQLRARSRRSKGD